MSLFKSLTKAVNHNAHHPNERQLIRQEAEIGAQIFGPIPKGHKREFFCLDAHTWIWHEEWKDANNQRKSLTTRYEVSKHNIVKVQDGQHKQQIRGQEAATFTQAVAKYYQLVGQHVYGVTA